MGDNPASGVGAPNEASERGSGSDRRPQDPRVPPLPNLRRRPLQGTLLRRRSTTQRRPFVAEIRRIAESGEVEETEEIEFGRKYTVPGELKGPAGVAQVLTVWIQETGQQDVRLVTVRPRWP